MIHLLSHSISLREDHILNGWPSRTAKSINSNVQDEKIEQECWFAVNNIKESVTWEKNGIKYKMFPAWTLNKLLESFCGVIFSKELIESLKFETKKRDTIFHIQGERSCLLWQILNAAKGSPVVMQFHGYYSPWPLIPLEKIFLTPVEKHYFKFINYFFVLAGSQRRYLIEKCNISENKIGDSALGVDFDTFKPTDKNQARQELNLPMDKNIILYVGLFNEVKGVDKIVKAHTEIKDKYNTFLILIGGNKNDKFYDYCASNADLTLEALSHDLLPKYFSSADVYCMICNKRKAKYAGLGIASAEALACNVPILNSDLDDAPEQIKEKIGFVVNSVEDLKDKLAFIISNKNKYRDLRKICEPFFAWEKITQHILRIYKNICEKNEINK